MTWRIKGDHAASRPCVSEAQKRRERKQRTHTRTCQEEGALSIYYWLATYQYSASISTLSSLAAQLGQAQAECDRLRKREGDKEKERATAAGFLGAEREDRLAAADGLSGAERDTAGKRTNAAKFLEERATAAGGGKRATAQERATAARFPEKRAIAARKKERATAAEKTEDRATAAGTT